MMTLCLYIWESCCIRKLLFGMDFKGQNFSVPLILVFSWNMWLISQWDYKLWLFSNLYFFIRDTMESTSLWKPAVWCLCCLQGCANAVTAVQLYHDNTQFWCGTYYQYASETIFLMWNPHCEKEYVFINSLSKEQT